MGNLTLYKAAEALAPLLDQVDEDGVISPELEQALAKFEGRGVAVTAYILNCEANAEMIRNAADKMAARAESMEKRAATFKRYLSDMMKRTSITEINSPEFSAKLLIERDASVDVFDSKQLPSEYWNFPPPPDAKPDKKRIASAIKEGKEIPGARVIKRDRLEIK